MDSKNSLQKMCPSNLAYDVRTIFSNFPVLFFMVLAGAKNLNVPNFKGNLHARFIITPPNLLFMNPCSSILTINTVADRTHLRGDYRR